MSTFADLQKKYNDFIVPACKIESGGAELSKEVFYFNNITVSNSMGSAAGACRFTLSNVYERGSRKFSADVTDKLKPGTDIKVSLGYGSDLSQVFAGYVDEMGFHFGSDDISINVNCMDGRALMRQGSSKEISADKDTTMQSVAEKILGKYSALLTTGDVTLEEMKNEANLTVQGSDLEFIVKAAKDRGRYFYIENGKSYIVKPQDTVCVEFGWEQFDMDFSMYYLDKKYVAAGYDHGKMEAFSAEEEAKSKAAQKELLTVMQSLNLSQSELGEAGKALLKAMAATDKRETFKGSISCRGIPEPKLGQKIKINDFPFSSISKTNSFTVVSIRHQFSTGSGFQTNLEVEG